MKGYNNFMSKKAFHPGSYANQKRIHEAEAKAEAKRKHDEEMQAQHQKEQELFEQKSLVSKQSKEKLSLNFMYEPPPGVDKHNPKKTHKAEWTSSTGKVETISSELPCTSNEPEPGINLEWKREKPVNKSSLQVRQGDKDSPSKTGISKEVEEKPKIDLQWKREEAIEISSNSTRQMCNKDIYSGNSARDKNTIPDIKPDVKRIKKER